MRRLAALVLVLAALAAGQPAAAQGLGSTFGAEGSTDPLTISAQDGIEWRQGSKVYIARGDAVATKGDVSVRAETLTAHYREKPDGGTDIWRIEADGGVLITTPSERATGRRGIYDVGEGVLVLTGEEVTFETPEQRITANQSLEYWETKQLAVARGNALAVQEGRRLRADVLSAYLRDEGEGRLGVHRMEAFGNVRIDTAQEVVRANYGDYNTDSGIATLSGSVRITRGENQLNGAYAEVNMKTGVSRLTGNPKASSGSSQRQVHGVFLPQEKPKPP